MGAVVDALLAELRCDPVHGRRLLTVLLASVTPDGPPAYYTSRRSGPRPPGWALDTWRAALPGIPGAARNGRWWTVTAEAYATWEASQSAVAPAPATTWSPAMAAASLRAPR